MNQKTHKPCKQCGTSFKMFRTTDKFCSPTCSNEYEDNKQAPSISSTRKPSQRIKQISDKRKQRLSGYSEWDMFIDIWKKRPHVSELSGKGLKYGPENPKEFVKQFLHVLPKGTYPSLRLEKENILLGTFEEHENQDQYPAFQERKVKMKQKVYMR
jgi:hypothetical protein